MKKVVFVDNDDLMQLSLGIAFKKQKDFEVIFFKIDIDALEFIKTNRIDLFVSDYNLGPSKGTLLIQTVKHSFPLMKTAILSAERIEDIRTVCDSVGVDTIISKHMNSQDLVSSILDLLAGD